MMERLTREMTFEEEYIILQKEVKELFDKEDRESEPPESHCVVRRALRCIKKLVSEVEQYKAYNDLEEQGLLLRFPCKVGDTVYRYVEEKGCVLEYTVWNISMSAYESGGIDIAIEGCAESEDEVEDEFSLSLIDFKNEFFNTKSEAEQKLKEMESD